MKDLGIYIHIPFCKSKCYYCDFCSWDNKNELISEYMKYLKEEIEIVGKSIKDDFENGRADDRIIKTIYIGGGTPSFIDSLHIKDIMQILKLNYNISSDVEATIEMNPGTITKQKLIDYKQSGINRISIGLQATKNERLKEIGRIHNFEEFLEGYNLVKEVGFNNINVDLIIGLPNQNLGEVENEIDEIIKLNPNHISVYSLIVEENTVIEKKISTKELILPTDELERKMYWRVKEKLQESGYVHYEISNFSKKGLESKHNLDCWNQKEYIGYGVAAHSYTDGARYSNVDSLEEYIDNWEKGKDIDNIIFHEKQTKQSMMNEYMILGLRKISGIEIKEFENKFSINPKIWYKKELDKLIKNELIEITDNHIRLTNKGIDFANVVWEEFV